MTPPADSGPVPGTGSAPGPVPVASAAGGRRGPAGHPVRRIYCVGRNYVEHIREMKEGDERDAPFFFQKPTDAVVPDGGTVRYPAATEDFQYEGELVASVGVSGEDIPVDSALAHVSGFAAGIDLTRRDRQREAASAGRPWEAGKSFDQSAPLGTVTPVAEVPDSLLTDGELSVWVNGELRQQCRFTQMIWNVPEIVANLSTQYRLEPGDLIYTGTPAGVGSLERGDTVRVHITGLDDLTVSVV